MPKKKIKAKEHGKSMGLLTMPSVKKLHCLHMVGTNVRAFLYETHNGQNSGVYSVTLDASEVAAALWKIAAARIARAGG